MHSPPRSTPFTGTQIRFLHTKVYVALTSRGFTCCTLKPVPGPDLQIQENVLLAPFTTLGVGGPARFFAEIHTEPQLLHAVAFARTNHLDLFPLGGGSNLLVGDTGFPGLVLHLTLGGDLTSTPAGPRHVDLRVPAGLDWDDLVLHACTQNLSGIECLAGIPGLTGGSPIQNIGAYGQEVAQTIHAVRALDLQTHTFTELSNKDCRFSYRSSLFNTSAHGRYGARSPYLVTAVTFRLSTDPTPNLTYADLQKRFAGQPTPAPLDVYHAVREIRRSKGMLLTPGDPDSRSAGSFFKNPIILTAHFEDIVRTLGREPSQIPHWPAPYPGSASEPDIKLAAAWLLEQAGFTKGYALGKAGISSRHTLALINRGDATHADLIALRDRIRSEVQSRFNISLEQEPVELGH